MTPNFLNIMRTTDLFFRPTREVLETQTDQIREMNDRKRVDKIIN